MRLIFMGTPDFAVPSLDAVIAAGHTIEAVFTQPDKPTGRGLKLTAPPVKRRALELGLHVYQPASIKKDENVQRQIAAINADCIVVAAYGKLLPPSVLGAAKYGCMNVHSSLLPKYRGAAPINWAVINGDSVSGVTIMQLDEGMDTGDILLQSETEIGKNETAGELHDRLAVMGANLLVQALDMAQADKLAPIKQEDALSSHAPMLDKTLSVIDWSRSAQQVHDLVRGLQPWPVALTTISGKKLKIHKTELVDDYSGKCGEVLSEKPFVVACGKGAVKILEVQGEGGKRMTAEDYLRGHHLEVGTIIG